jgi:hypothetical protein
MATLSPFSATWRNDVIKKFTDILALAAGYVVGPASATNDNLAAFDGATGKLLKDSGVAIPTNGTFTPTVSLVGGAGNTTPVYTTNTGRYSVIGRRVFVDIYLDGDGGAEGAGSGAFAISLPVQPSASNPLDPFPGGTARNSTTEYLIAVEIVASSSFVALSYFDAITNRVTFTGAQQNNTTRFIRLNFNYEW